MTLYYIVCTNAKGGPKIVGEGYGKADATAQLKAWQARMPRGTFRLERD